MTLYEALPQIIEGATWLPVDSSNIPEKFYGTGPLYKDAANTIPALKSLTMEVRLSNTGKSLTSAQVHQAFNELIQTSMCGDDARRRFCMTTNILTK